MEWLIVLGSIVAMSAVINLWSRLIVDPRERRRKIASLRGQGRIVSREQAIELVSSGEYAFVESQTQLLRWVWIIPLSTYDPFKNRGSVDLGLYGVVKRHGLFVDGIPDEREAEDFLRPHRERTVICGMRPLSS